MEVILREDVTNLGGTGDVVKVKPGFARNYLLPRGLAVVADHRNIRVLEHQKRLAAGKRDRDRGAAESLAQKLTSCRLVIRTRAGEEGRLFGSVTNLDIERSLGDAGFEIERRRIRLEDPIKSLGEHSVAVQLSGGVMAHVTVVVEAIEP
jgi:large subunit ribosomal protein L9